MRPIPIVLAAAAHMLRMQSSNARPTIRLPQRRYRHIGAAAVRNAVGARMRHHAERPKVRLAAKLAHLVANGDAAARRLIVAAVVAGRSLAGGRAIAVAVIDLAFEAAPMRPL